MIDHPRPPTLSFTRNKSKRSIVSEDVVPIVLPHTNEQGAMIPVMCLSVSPAGNLIAAGCSDGAVRVWAYGDAADDAAWGTGKHNTRRTGRDTIGRGEVYRREAPPPPASQIDSIAAANAAAAAAAVAASRPTAASPRATAAGARTGAAAGGTNGAEAPLPPGAAGASAPPLLSLSPPPTPPLPPPPPQPLWNPAASGDSPAVPTGLAALAEAAVADGSGSATGAGSQLAGLSLEPSPSEGAAAGGAAGAAGGAGAGGVANGPLSTLGLGQLPQPPPPAASGMELGERRGGGGEASRGRGEREQRRASAGDDMGGLEVRLATKLFGEC